MPNPAWHPDLTAWQSRWKITYTPTRTLSGFPNLLRVGAGPLAFLKADGTDLRVVDHSGGGNVILNREIDSWGESAGTVWANAALEASVEKELYVYGENAAAEDMPLANRQAVWDANYDSVIHLNSSGATDSTANARAISITGTTATGGQIGNCLDFNGTSDFATVAVGSIAANATIEAWIYWDAQTWALARDNTVGGGWVFGYGIGEWFAYRVAGSSFNLYPIVPVTEMQGAWLYVALVKSEATTAYYRNDTVIHNGSGVANTAMVTPVYLMRNSTYDNYIDGKMDEFRISNVARSADWIIESYAQQSGDVWAWGERETPPAGGAAAIIINRRRRFFMGAVT